MARKKIIQFENTWYHIMNRGAARRNIFKNEKQTKKFLSLLAEIHSKYSIEIHAYCLMSNHYHLLVCTPKTNLPECMKHLNGIYSKFHNIDSKTDGPIFKDRYKSILIDSDQYLIQVCRYIHLNPVKAKLTNGINHTWSSYKYYANKNISSPSWLHKEEILAILNDDSTSTKFINFHEQGDSGELIKFYETNNSRHNTMENKVTLENLQDIIMQHFKINCEDFATTTAGKTNLPRIIFYFMSLKIYKYTTNLVSNYLGVDKENAIQSALSRQKVILKKYNITVVPINKPPTMIVAELEKLFVS
jgi:REP element-mobilizing transposase RayT